MKSSRNLFFFAWILCGFLGIYFNANQLNAKELNYTKISENGTRLYLDPSQVIVNQNGIFFFADGQYYPTNTLVHDESGLGVDLTPMYWICKNGHINPLYVYPCRICHEGMPGT